MTEVLGGENDGKTLANHNIVVGLEPVGQWAGGPQTITVAGAAATSEGCAILVQTRAQGPVLAGAYCP